MIEEYKKLILSNSIHDKAQAKSIATNFIEHYTKNRGISSWWHRGDPIKRHRNLLIWTLLTYFQLKKVGMSTCVCDAIFDIFSDKVEKQLFKELADINELVSLIKSNKTTGSSKVVFGSNEELTKKISEKLSFLFEKQLHKTSLNNEMPNELNEDNIKKCVNDLISQNKIDNLVKVLGIKYSQKPSFPSNSNSSY